MPQGLYGQHGVHSEGVLLITLDIPQNDMGM